MTMTLKRLIFIFMGLLLLAEAKGGRRKYGRKKNPRRLKPRRRKGNPRRLEQCERNAQCHSPKEPRAENLKANPVTWEAENREKKDEEQREPPKRVKQRLRRRRRRRERAELLNKPCNVGNRKQRENDEAQRERIRIKRRRRRRERAEKKSLRAAKLFREGSRVEYTGKKTGTTFQGVIMGINGDGTFEVVRLDGKHKALRKDRLTPVLESERLEEAMNGNRVQKKPSPIAGPMHDPIPKESNSPTSEADEIWPEIFKDAATAAPESSLMPVMERLLQGPTIEGDGEAKEAESSEWFHSDDAWKETTVKQAEDAVAEQTENNESPDIDIPEDGKETPTDSEDEGEYLNLDLADSESDIGISEDSECSDIENSREDDVAEQAENNEWSDIPEDKTINGKETPWDSEDEGDDLEEELKNFVEEAELRNFASFDNGDWDDSWDEKKLANFFEKTPTGRSSTSSKSFIDCFGGDEEEGDDFQNATAEEEDGEGDDNNFGEAWGLSDSQKDLPILEEKTWTGPELAGDLDEFSNNGTGDQPSDAADKGDEISIREGVFDVYDEGTPETSSSQATDWGDESDEDGDGFHREEKSQKFSELHEFEVNTPEDNEDFVRRAHNHIPATDKAVPFDNALEMALKHWKTQEAAVRSGAVSPNPMPRWRHQKSQPPLKKGCSIRSRQLPRYLILPMPHPDSREQDGDPTAQSAQPVQTLGVTQGPLPQALPKADKTIEEMP